MSQLKEREKQGATPQLTLPPPVIACSANGGFPVHSVCQKYSDEEDLNCKGICKERCAALTLTLVKYD